MQKRSILLIVFLDLFGFGLILPLLPFAGQSFGASSVGIGLLAATFPFFQTFAMPFWGKLSDRIGRKPVILVSVFGAIAAYLVFGFAQSFLMLLISRAIAGCMAANLGVAKAYLADISDPLDKNSISKNMGLYAAAQALGFLVGPAVGGALSQYGVRGVGFLASALSGVSLLLAATALKESLRPELRISKQKSVDILSTLRAQPKLLHSSIVFFLITLAFSHLFIAFPLLLQETLGYGGRETGYFFVLLSVIGILIQGVFFGKLIRKYSEKKLLDLGLILMAISLLVFPLFKTVSGMVAFVLFVALGYSLANPSILSRIAKSVSEKEQGVAAGVSESLGGAGRIIGPLVAGLMIRAYGVYFGFVSSAVATAICWIYLRLSASSGLASTVMRVHLVSSQRRAEMFDLFQRYYKDVDFELFSKDLSEKNYVLLFWDHQTAGSDKLIGFSTILLRPEGGRVKSLFSGDTVVHEDYWGSKILQKAFSRFIAATKLSHPIHKVYWMLMSKGFKTYLLMRHNFSHSFPNHRKPTPGKMETLKTRFYTEKFGDAFDPRVSKVHFKEPHGAVRGSIAAPPEGTLQDPEVKFFLENNPQWAQGDEYACIAEIRLRDIFYVMTKYVLSFSRLAKKRQNRKRD